MSDLKELYFDWMYDLVCGRLKNYRRLLHFLHETEFTYTIPMDGNRYEDGVDLRYRFGYEHDVDQAIITKELDIYPCSILEMMVALAIRCEDHIMSNSELGDRTGMWFFYMLDSLGVDMTDEEFNEEKATHIIKRFLDHKYKPDGLGGLFYIQNIGKDMTKVQIWDQAMWYLNTRL